MKHESSVSIHKRPMNDPGGILFAAIIVEGRCWDNQERVLQIREQDEQESKAVYGGPEL